MSETELQRRLRADFPTEILASRPDLTQLLLDAVAALTTAERELAEARAEVETERACHEECCRQADAADTTRREWEVRAATSYRDGRAAGLREAAAKLAELRDEWEVMMGDGSVAHNCGKIAHGHVIALAPPAADKHALYAAASRIAEPGPGESVAAGRPRAADTTISSTSTTGAEATTHTCAAPPERP